MLRGETVIIRTYHAAGFDAFGAKVREYADTEVGDVLVEPGASSNVTESNRPDGVSIRYTLHFPKTFDGALDGAQIMIRGDWYDVIGRPDHYTLENTPTKWWMTVEVGVVNG